MSLPIMAGKWRAGAFKSSARPRLAR